MGSGAAEQLCNTDPLRRFLWLPAALFLGVLSAVNPGLYREL